MINLLTNLLGFEAILIIATLIVSSLSYASQKRASVREALEQLEPRYISYSKLTGGSRIRGDHHRSVQAKPALREYSLFGQYVEVTFLFNKVNDASDRVVRQSVPSIYPSIGTHKNIDNPLRQRLLENDKIIGVERQEYELVLKFNTTNPVECRQAANYALLEMEKSRPVPVRQEDFKY